MRRARGLAATRSPSPAAGLASVINSRATPPLCGDAGASGVFVSAAASAWPLPLLAGAVPAPSRALLSSPSSSRRAIGSLTFTPSVPPGTRILPSVPSSTASTSMVALSVSISAITSPDLTASPSFFSHLARLPSVMVGDRAGIRILIGMVLAPA